jgi:DNA-binding LytR/AlgR family response regulator
MKIRCLLIDDEPIALDILKSYIADVPYLELVGTCSNALESYSILQKEKIDLLFLDIKMPQLTGIEFIKTLDHKPHIILVTAYSEYALDAFEYDVLDYLLKPVSFQRFLKSVNKAMNRLQVKTEHLINDQSPESSFMYLKHDKKNVKVMLNDILYFEGCGNYVKVVTSSKEILTYQTLNFLEKQLSGDGFLRIHKSYIISLNKIDAFTTETVEVKQHELPIGNSYRQMVSKVLG